MNPASGGTPAIDAALTTATTLVGPHPAPRAGSARMSRVPAWWSTMPTTMNSAALNRPWAISRAQPATVASGSPEPEQHDEEARAG